MTSSYFPDLDPLQIARDVAEMWWPELDQLAHEILGRMALVAEASGASLEARVASGKPGGQAPRGDVSLVDEWSAKFAEAVAIDMADMEAGQHPTRLGWVVIGAAGALHRVKHRGPAADDPDPDHAGVERHDAIIAIYEGIEPPFAAALETARAGFVTASAIRSCRKANGRHRETGLPVPLGDDLKASIRRHSSAGMSAREIARIVDCGKTTVVRVLALDADGNDRALEAA